MPARHEDTQDHWKQQFFPNLSSFHSKSPLCLDIKPLLIQHRGRAFRQANKENLPSGFWKRKLVAIGTVYSKKQYIYIYKYILMLYSAFHMLGVNVSYLGNVEWF